MKKQKILISICLLIAGLAFEGCNLSVNNSSKNSDILGKWKDMGVIWSFNSDGSYRAESTWVKKRDQTGMYHVKGERLIIDCSEGDIHYEYTWYKPDENHLIFGNEAGGYWKCERVY